MLHFIINPHAGSSRGIRTFRKLEPELCKYHLSYDVVFTQYPGHASEEARRLCDLERAPKIAVLGGDGTMHEVLEGLRADISLKAPPRDVCATLTFLPCGSGNDFARGLHLTKDPAKFARGLSLYCRGKAAKEKRFAKSVKAVKNRDSNESGKNAESRKANGRTIAKNTPSSAPSAGDTASYINFLAVRDSAASAPSLIRLHYGCGHAQGVSQGFFVSGGMGFDSSVTEEINMSPLKAVANHMHLSTLAYLLLGIRQIITEPQAAARIVVDDKKQLVTDRLFFLSAHKMRCEGGGFPFAPDADPESDFLSVCIFYGMSRAACTWALFLSLFGLHRYKRGVALLKCKKVEVFSETFRSTHTDGESLGFVDHVCFTAGEGTNVS